LARPRPLKPNPPPVDPAPAVTRAPLARVSILARHRSSTGQSLRSPVVMKARPVWRLFRRSALIPLRNFRTRNLTLWQATSWRVKRILEDCFGELQDLLSAAPPGGEVPFRGFWGVGDRWRCRPAAEWRRVRAGWASSQGL